MNQPTKNLVFIGKVTNVQMWNSFFKIDQGRNLFNSILSSFLRIVQLDKDDSIPIAIVINGFKVFKDF